MSTTTETIFDRIGGQAAIEAAVDVFYRKVLADPTISHFFDGTDMEEQRAKQKAFLTMVFGGTDDYTGKDLRSAHAPLVAKGLNDAHFDAVAGHLQATLDELGVDAESAGVIMETAAGTRDEVLNR